MRSTAQSRSAAAGITGYGKGTTADGGNSMQHLVMFRQLLTQMGFCNVTITPATNGSQTVTIAWAAAS